MNRSPLFPYSKYVPSVQQGSLNKICRSCIGKLSGPEQQKQMVQQTKQESPPPVCTFNKVTSPMSDSPFRPNPKACVHFVVGALSDIHYRLQWFGQSSARRAGRYELVADRQPAMHGCQAGGLSCVCQGLASTSNPAQYCGKLSIGPFKIIWRVIRPYICHEGFSVNYVRAALYSRVKLSTRDRIPLQFKIFKQNLKNTKFKILKFNNF